MNKKTDNTPKVEQLLSIFENRNTIRLTMDLYEKPERTTAEVADLLEVSRSTAFRYLNQLQDAGILECTWKVSRSSAPKAVKSFSLTETGKELIKLLLPAIKNMEN